jgi:6-phosphogluconolactonase/glucosamine-6-phosphate isomerase/deaminase
MSFTIKTTGRPEDAAGFVALSIFNQLKLGKRVLFFVTGGSSIAVGSKIAELLGESPQPDLIKNLTVMMTDERYGPPGHQDSNWQQLIEKGFNLPLALLVPILTGEDRSTATIKFNEVLNREFMRVEYKIGLFGVGADGHTAGIMPESGAVSCQDLAYSYDTPTFSRVTITPQAIEKLDEAVVFMQGEEKWGVVKDLLEKNIEIIKQPAQVLKKVPLLTIFTDKKIKSR